MALVATVVVIVSVGGCGSDGDEATQISSGDSGAIERGAGPRLGEDHWHSAYAIWICDRFLEPLTDLHGDAHGIHTHVDGLIHIHPTTNAAAGDAATLGVFGDEVGVQFSDAGFSLPSGDAFENGDECDGAEAVVRVLEWRPGAPPREAIVHEADFSAVPLDANGVAYTIAFMRPDTPLEELYPPSALDHEPPEAPSSVPRPSVDDVLPPPAERGSVPLPAFEGGGQLLFRPVLSIRLDEADDPSGDAIAGADGMRYVLGPPLPTAMLEAAEVVPTPMGTWGVSIVLREGSPGIDDFNRLAARCVELAPDCPTGQIAVVLEDVVLTAPAVHLPSFERDALVINGDFSEQQARDIVAAIG